MNFIKLGNKIITTSDEKLLLVDNVTKEFVEQEIEKKVPTKLSQLEIDVDLGAVINLGEIGNPIEINNEILNAATNPGVYTFTTTESYSGGYYINANVYFMVVERTDTEGRAVEQFIYSCDVPRDHTSKLSNLTIIRRTKSKTSGSWVVKSIVIPSQEYVDNLVGNIQTLLEEI